MNAGRRLRSESLRAIYYASGKHKPSPSKHRAWFGIFFTVAAAQQVSSSSVPIYKQSNAPVERRVDDLIRRLTLAEKVRQLDLYSGAQALVDKHNDDTHAAPDAIFVPERAQSLFGTLGVFTIVANHVSAQDKYIQSATLNGKSWSKPWFAHCPWCWEMGGHPNFTWVTRPEDEPPSMTPVE